MLSYIIITTVFLKNVSENGQWELWDELLNNNMGLHLKNIDGVKLDRTFNFGFK